MHYVAALIKDGVVYWEQLTNPITTDRTWRIDELSVKVLDHKILHFQDVEVDIFIVESIDSKEKTEKKLEEWNKCSTVENFSLEIVQFFSKPEKQVKTYKNGWYIVPSMFLVIVRDNKIILEINLKTGAIDQSVQDPGDFYHLTPASHRQFKLEDYYVEIRI